METIEVVDMPCPRCGSNFYLKDWLPWNLLVCAGKEANGANCIWLAYAYCPTCGQHYTRNDFFRRQDGQYVCKACGTPHNGVTTYLQMLSQVYLEKLSPEEKRLLQLKQEADAFAERMRRERME